MLASTDKFEQLSKSLLVSTYDPDRRLYMSGREETCGFLLEVEPISFMGKQTLDGFTSFLSAKWPKNSVVQFVLYADPNLDPIIQGYRALRGLKDKAYGDPMKELLFDWANDHASYMNSKRLTGIDPLEVPVPYRNFRGFISAKVPCTMEEFYFRRSNDLVNLQENRESLIGILKTSHIYHKQMLPDEYIRLMYQFMNPGHPYPLPIRTGEDLKSRFREDDALRVLRAEGTIEEGRRYVGWDQDRPIHDQVIETDTMMRRFKDHLRLDKQYVLTKTVKEYPDRVSPIDINLLIGDIGRANRRQINCPFIMTLNLDMNPQEKQIGQKGNLVLMQSNSLPGLRAKILKRHQEFSEANSRIEAGERFINGYLSMVFFAKSKEQLASVSAQTNSLWQAQGYELQTETRLHAPLFLASAPLNATSHFIQNLGDKRVRPAPARTYAMLAPLQSDPPEFSMRPIIPLISRRGQMFGLDLMTSDTNYNGLVVAPSGSGKSFAVNAKVLSYLSIGGRAFILDQGRSYEKLCRMLGGQYIEFTQESDISLNIFSLLTRKMWRSDDPDVAAQREVLRTTCEQVLAQMANPSTPISETEEQLLSLLMSEVFEELESDDEYFTIDKLIDKLNAHQEANNLKQQRDTLADHLAKRLFRYSSKGKHGHWFKGPYNIEFDQPLVVLELEELRANEDLKQVVLMLIIASIEHRLYIDPDRSRDTLIILDEAWDMLTGANTAKFIESGFRRARKYGASFIVITQSIFDLRDKNKEIGDAILSNTAWRFFLQPKAEEVERAVAENLLSLRSDYAKSLLLSTHTSRGQYSEICYIDPRGNVGVGRLHVNRFTELLFTTNPRELDLINEFRQLGLGTTEAIQHAVNCVDDLRRGHDPKELARKYQLANGLKAGEAA